MEVDISKFPIENYDIDLLNDVIHEMHVVQEAIVKDAEKNNKELGELWDAFARATALFIVLKNEIYKKAKIDFKFYIELVERHRKKNPLLAWDVAYLQIAIRIGDKQKESQAFGWC